MWTYFDKGEFGCSCGCGQNKMRNYIIDKLDDARAFSGVVFRINSGYRCPTYDKSLGGKGNHPTGMAADIHCVSSRDRWHMINALIEVGFKRIGIADTFIHVDDNDNKPKDLIWTY